MTRRLTLILAATTALVAPAQALAQSTPDGLLFRMSADTSLTADIAGGNAEPTFADKVRIVSEGGANGGYVQAADDQVLAWSAPGNIYAQRGTIAFDWRAREPLGENPFPIFRVSYANHSSWDMVWLRIDWNGHGFDGFVTDANLSRVRVSWRMPEVPSPDTWTNIAFSWDEAEGVKLYVNGQLAAKNETPALLDAGLDQFGPHSRIISPIQVQSRYNFLRGGDIDEISIWDHAMTPGDVASGSASDEQADWKAAWDRRLGFDAAPPPYLADAQTSIRRVEFTEQRDVAQRMWKGNDGVRETTWPGVYNRSRLTGRHDYFTLPDWNVYSTGGQSAAWFLPDEPWNQIEIQGAAFGRLSVLPGATVPEGNGQITDPGDLLARRSAGTERSTTRLGQPVNGGAVRFVNDKAETPIEEIGVYNVGPGSAPDGLGIYAFTIRANVEPDFAATEALAAFIAGRYPEGERGTVAALPAGYAGATRTTSLEGSRPLAHVIVPVDFRRQGPGKPLWRGTTFGYENAGGLDGIELTLPALNVSAGPGGLIPLNIRIKDPLEPSRDLMDVNVSVKPGEARTLWLDTRDRIPTPDASVYFTVASSRPDFTAASLDGAGVRLVFKPREEALAEHVTDRMMAVRDNYGFLVEERQSNRNLGLFDLFYRDLSDVLRVDPGDEAALAYWSEWNPQQPLPAFEQPEAPAGVPLWAFRQTEALKQVRHFLNWWVDNRQVDGEFGGGLSDDTDLMNQWPGAALMGVDPDKLNASLSALIEATYANGMWSNGLGTIVTDELHVYEEGVNAISQSEYLNRGDPLTVERLMQTAARYDELTEVNPAGHRHFVSNYFGGDEIVREAPWQWSKAQSQLILHPGLRLVEYNGSPELKALLLELADGFLAHGRQDANGRWTFPSEINWPDDAERGPREPDLTNLLMLSAWRWTGDDKYLAPIRQVIEAGGIAALGNLATSDLALELGQPELNATAAKQGDSPSASRAALHAAWSATGDKAYLERLYAGLIQSAAIRMPMMTTDQWWTDRVEVPHQELQRERLGGIALTRNAIVPGNRISWRFDDPDGAEKLAVLVREPTRTGFRVIAYNLSDQPVNATISGGEVADGQWSISQGMDADGDDRADGALQSRQASFGPGKGVDVTFAPGQTTVLEFSLAGAEADIRNRPDAAIAARDVRWNGRRLEVTVHSLGSQSTSAGRVALIDAEGAEIASAPLAGLDAPNDLKPRTATVRLSPPRNANLTGARIEVRLDGSPSEISAANNTAAVPTRSAR